METPYRDLTELILHCVNDRDYRFTVVDRGADVTLAAIHGGGIEPLTSELALAIAGEDHNYYAFCGLRAQSNQLLRLPVARFREVRLDTLMARSRIGLSVLGVEGKDDAVHLGGRNQRLKRLLAEALEGMGVAVLGPSGQSAAHHPDRFINKPREGGVQMELTRALRAGLVDCPLADRQWEDPAHWNARLHTLVSTVRGALDTYLATMRDDLEVALHRFENATRTFPDEVRRAPGRPDETDASA
ncbi:MAG: poly-gamma-glutamate hydrolase family protein [Anaerolineae bacterium]